MISVLSPEDGHRLLQGDTPVYLVDVRTPAEHQRGHIPASLNLPLDTLEETAEAVLSDKSRPLLVYCRSGVRAAQAAAILDGLGYQDIRSLGGILSWPFELVR